MYQGYKNNKMTRGEKISKLIDALDEGFVLFKDHKEGTFLRQDPEFEYMFKSGNFYELKGWGSALGDFKDRLLDIIQNPDSWKIFPIINMNTHDYPYPWSTKWEEK